MNEVANRPIHQIAAEIKKLWLKPNFAAAPYLDAMMSLSVPTDKYYCDGADEIVIRFLSNATSWHGDDAKRIKAELKRMFKVK